jgi:hypothetical protein
MVLPCSVCLVMSCQHLRPTCQAAPRLPLLRYSLMQLLPRVQCQALSLQHPPCRVMALSHVAA